jgi:PPOX class probable F420-dependent enzyme
VSLDAVHERYVSLATFRRDGREVRTPVWIAEDRAAGTKGQLPTKARRLFVYTNRTSGKVKRVRATKRVRLAACDFRGTVRGEWADGEARLLEDPVDMEHAFSVLTEKYGWQMRAGLLLSRLSGRYPQRGILEIRLASR